MEELVLELKKEIIEALNLEDITPEDIDADAPLFGSGLGFRFLRGGYCLGGGIDFRGFRLGFGFLFGDSHLAGGVADALGSSFGGCVLPAVPRGILPCLLLFFLACHSGTDKVWSSTVNAMAIPQGGMRRGLSP